MNQNQSTKPNQNSPFQPVTMMPLPPANSALLDRLKKFLPEIAQANEELEKKIQEEGAESVRIDLTMEPVVAATEGAVAENADETADSAMAVEPVESKPKKKSLIQVVGEEEDDESSDGEDVIQDSAAMGQRVIELNFALGDFDETPIAKLEDTEMNQETEGDNAN